MKRKFKWFFVVLVAGFTLLQFTNPPRTNPPVVSDLIASNPPPPQVAATLHAACYDCHSSQTRWPWYSRVAPMSWLIASDVKEGRKNLNLSNWPNDNPLRAAKQLENMSDEISSGEMPLPKYTKIHADARLTEIQRKELMDWLDAEAARLKEPVLDFNFGSQEFCCGKVTVEFSFTLGLTFSTQMTSCSTILESMKHIRNIAIIAHVDHGKTTLVDCLLKQSGTFRENQHESKEERLMDSMDLEKEKGITIRAKNAAFKYKDFHINIVDTPGHADFGGEVERIMNMIDGVLLVVDSAEGPQAQTRFVLRKALEAGAKPIVVINKIDRENANPKKVLDQVFELFMSLNATDEQLDFPFIYASAKQGYAKTELTHVTGTMEPLFDAIVKHIPSPRAKAGDGFQVLVANLDYNDYVGRIAFGKIVEGKVKVGDAAICRHGNGKITKNKITMIYHFEGMKRIEIAEAHAGDIVGLAGFEDVFIGETICDSEARTALPYIPIDPPTIQMEFAVNDGPLAGQDGKLVTARHIWDRLVKEIRTNVALRIAQTSDPKVFAVSGRGEMQIAILVEQMRREGYEVLVSRPEVLWKKGPAGELLEPIEKLFVEIPSENLGNIMENLAARKAQITNMNHVGTQVSVEALVPMRGLIGFETDLVNSTKGMGVMSHLFHEYGADCGEIAARKNGSLVSMDAGEATSYALNMVQERGRLMVEPGDNVYIGMIVGENTRENDIPVNPVKEKRLTNMRSQGDGKGIQLAPPMKLSLERALEYIDVDEFVEATPKSLRLRKKELDENKRKRSGKSRVIKFVQE